MMTLGGRVLILMGMVLLTGCFATGGASLTANEQADKHRYQKVDYANASKKGPYLVVLPGQVKSNYATFRQAVLPTNIADYAELELSNANFRVLEREDLGPMLNEINLAFNMGDRRALKKFKRGKFKSTQWLVRFDILKAEPVASASTSFDGGTLGRVISVLGGSSGAYKAGTVVGTVDADEEANIWLVGMRYKVLNANTSEQVASGYFEEKLEKGSSSGRILGFGSSQSGGAGLDTMTHRLVQLAVQDLDRKK